MQSLIKKAINSIPNWNSESITVIQEISNSITSYSYLVEKERKNYVLRIDKPFDQGVVPDRKNELQILKILSEKNLSNKLIYSDLTKGILLTEYIQARVWDKSDLENEEQLIRLAKALKSIHALKLGVENNDLIDGITRYKNQINTMQADSWSNEALELIAQCSKRASVLCHNDLHVLNILESENLHFIDWEYAGLGNPLFDICSILQQQELSTQLSDAFTNTYFSELTDLDRGDIQKYKRIHDLLLALWLSVLIKSASNNNVEDLESEKKLKVILQRL